MEAEAGPVSVAAPRGAGERILYVDDEERLVFLARRGLERYGFAFTGFTDPRQAWFAFESDPGAFDLIVTDLAMPGMTGLDFAAKVLQARPAMPILLTSGYLRPQDQERASRMGLHDYIAKPAVLDGLARAIHTALNRGGKADRP